MERSNSQVTDLAMHLAVPGQDGSKTPPIHVRSPTRLGLPKHHGRLVVDIVDPDPLTIMRCHARQQNQNQLVDPDSPFQIE